MKILFQGREVEATEVSFKTVKEDWNEYVLKDGETLKIKLVLTNVLRLDAYDPATGDPHYLIKSGNIVAVHNVPEKLKRPVVV
ncbi:MAG: hypothetical protein AOA65_0477 [Candidatus Bathyarchaeota archaeon BA1]|nr:MAG: hypothetical protein AOA65_0477 [Candidatus Bathyarchaeota archaeon BA1]